MAGSSDEYDVIVAGAGPAGATAARYAALGGARTLLVERRRVVGRPVQCGEFIPTFDELRRFLPGGAPYGELFPGLDAAVRTRTRTLRVHSPAGRACAFPFEGVVVDRDELDRSRAEAAVAAGAELRTETRLDLLEGEFVGISSRDSREGGKVRARVVIGADGPRSAVAREAGFAPFRHMAFGVQYLARGSWIDPGLVEMFFGAVAPGGYAWVIPKGEGVANVGLGLRTGRRRSEARGMLEEFIGALERRRGALETSSFTAGLIPVDGPRRRTVRGNVLLAGDAAGHLMPCNGGGIPTAVVCGRIAGRVAAAHVRGGTPLSEYEPRWRAAVGSELSHAVTTRRIFDLVARSAAATEVAMSLAGPSGTRDLVTCRSWLRAAVRP